MELMNGKVRVYNYEKNPIGFPSDANRNGVFIEATKDDEPIMVYVLWSDIEQENTKSDIFRTGRIRFHKDEEDEIYKKLGITDRENIMTNKELANLLMDKSIENLKKIDKIKSINLITRMKSLMVNMSISGDTIPNQVISVVNEKYDELRYGGRKNENSYLNKLDKEAKEKEEQSKIYETVNALAKQVEELKQQKADTEAQSQSALSDLLQMVQALKAENDTLKKTNEVKKEEVESKTTKSNRKKAES